MNNVKWFKMKCTPTFQNSDMDEFNTRKVSAESILGAFSMMPRIQDSYSCTQDHEMHQE